MFVPVMYPGDRNHFGNAVLNEFLSGITWSFLIGKLPSSLLIQDIGLAAYFTNFASLDGISELLLIVRVHHTVISIDSGQIVVVRLISCPPKSSACHVL